MKLNKLMILGATVGLSGMAQADIVVEPVLGQQQVKVAAVKQAVKGEFGAFKLEPSLQVVPSSVASSNLVVAEKNGMSIVSGQATDDLIGKGTVVRNTLTNELTTLTGNITVLLNKGASADALASAAGLEVVSIFPGTDIAVFTAEPGADLLKAFNSISESGLAIESKVEVTDTIYTAQ